MNHTTPHDRRALARRVTTKLAVLAATLAGVLALTFAPASTATAQEPCPITLQVDASTTVDVVAAQIAAKLGDACARVEVKA